MVVQSVGIAVVVVVTLRAYVCVGGGSNWVRAPSVCSSACFPDRFITRLVCAAYRAVWRSSTVVNHTQPKWEILGRQIAQNGAVPLQEMR